MKKIKNFLKGLIYKPLPLSIANKYIGSKRLENILRLRLEQQSFQLMSYEYSRNLINDLKKDQPLNPAIHGSKYYSQFDEDGIIEEIISRFEQVAPKTFLEIGVGGGLEIENNTTYLLLKGFTGYWIDSSKSNVETICQTFKHQIASQQLKVLNEFITEASISTLPISALSSAIFSLDIDSFDLDILRHLLNNQHFTPSLIVVEYNAQFGPVASVSVNTDLADHKFKDSYFGASLMAFASLLFDNNYILICCGLSGANAYFIKRSLLNSNFDDMFVDNLPKRVAYLFQPPRYFLAFGLRSGLFPSFGDFKNV
ncbi:hypothetical protein SynRS9915_00500 [Synechococcus sp. RS9915]|nr:hypothetical protein SynRS9915_00500 [Synechococcus sp. RS9915]